MYAPTGVKIDHNTMPIPERYRAWVLGNPGELHLVDNQNCRHDER